VGAVVAAPEAAAVEVVAVEVVELAEVAVELAEVAVELAEVAVLVEGLELAEVAVELVEVAVLVEGLELAEVVGREEEAVVEAGQAPAVVTAEVEAQPRSGPGASPETRGLPQTPRPASAWHRRGHSPSAGRYPFLSSG
jgi:hypothetical protein